MRRRALIRAGVFGALIALIGTLPGLWLGTLWDNSETAYSEVARELLRTHDSVVMHLNGVAWFIQPPLYFWCAAFFAKLLGVTSFAMRLPSLLATVFMGVSIAVFTTRTVGARAGRYATLLLSTMLMQVVIGRLAIMDAMLDACTTVAVFAGARAFLGEARRDERGSALIAAAIAIALGILTKGPVALALPVLILGPWLLGELRLGRRAAPPRLSIVLAAVAGLAILAPWFIMFGLEAGGRGLSEFVVHYTVGRYLGVIENQTGPPYYYIPVLILGFFPWTGIVVAAIVDALQNNARILREPSLHGSLVRLGVLWTLLPAIFFSFAQTKLPNYVAVSLPGAAMLGGLWLDENLPRRRKHVLWAVGLVPLLTGAMLAAMILFAQHNTLGAQFSALENYTLIFILAFLLSSVAAMFALTTRRTARNSPLWLAGGTIIAMVVLACGAVPAADEFKPMPKLAAIITGERQPGDIVALQGVGGMNSLMFYTAPPITPLDSPDVPPSSAATDPKLVIPFAARVWLVAPARRPIPDPTYGRRRTLIATFGNDTLFLIDGPVRNSAPAARTTQKTSPPQPKALRHAAKGRK